MSVRTTKNLLNKPHLILIASLCMSIAPLAQALPAFSLTKVLGGSQAITKASWFAQHKVLTTVGASLGGLALLGLLIYWWRKPISNPKFARRLTEQMNTIDHDYQAIFALDLTNPQTDHVLGLDSASLIYQTHEMHNVPHTKTILETFGENQSAKRWDDDWAHKADKDYLRRSDLGKLLPVLRAKILIEDDLVLMQEQKRELAQRATTLLPSEPAFDKAMCQRLDSLIQNLSNLVAHLNANHSLSCYFTVFYQQSLPRIREAERILRIEEENRRLRRDNFSLALHNLQLSLH